jgi:heme exporter protein C
MRTAIKILFGLGIAAITYWSFAVPDAELFRIPELARIFFFHFPCSIALTFLLMWCAVPSLLYLRTGDRKWDIHAESAQELAFIFAILVMVTGIIFSKVQWGAWWQWDPRQSSFLLVLLIDAAYFVVRSGFSDVDRRAAISNAYALAAILPILFLIFIFPRLPQIAAQSFHPSNTITNQLFDRDYGLVILGTVSSITILAVWLYLLRVRAGMLEYQMEALDGLEIDRSRPTPTGVVRPVSVSDEDGR